VNNYLREGVEPKRRIAEPKRKRGKVAESKQITIEQEVSEASESESDKSDSKPEEKRNRDIRKLKDPKQITLADQPVKEVDYY
jgi:hypothetical protein